VTPKRISAVVLTLNEEHNIEYCLRSVRPWCDELVLVDMFSDDRTVELARPYVDTVLAHERIHAFDLGRQRGIDAATGDWIFSIDADEVVPPQLGRWMRAFVDADPEYDLAQIPRINVFLGRRMHSTPWWPGKPRLFRRGAVLVTADLHHGLVPRAGARVAQVPKKPQLSLWHFTRLSIDALTAKMNHYTTIEARQANARGRGDPPGRSWFGAAFREVAVYVYKRGYRDGFAGLAYMANRAYYKFLRQAKRWDEARSGLRQAQYDLMREKILSGYPHAGAQAAGTIIAPATLDAELSDGVTVGRMGEHSNEGVSADDATG